MPWPAIIGGIIGGGLSYLGAREANKETAKSVSNQMAFQERMSNTAHQRQVKDLRAAGLNPILSVRLGGASTPSGASYVARNALGEGVQGFNQVSNAVSTARTAASQVGLNQATIRKIDAEITQLVAQVGLTEVQTEAVIEGIKKVMPEIERIKADAGMKQAISAIPTYVKEVLDLVPRPGEIRQDMSSAFKALDNTKAEKKLYGIIFKYLYDQIMQWKNTWK